MKVYEEEYEEYMYYYNDKRYQLTGNKMTPVHTEVIYYLFLELPFLLCQVLGFQFIIKGLFFIDKKRSP